jgi:hypothetical protein
MSCATEFANVEEQSSEHCPNPATATCYDCGQSFCESCLVLTCCDHRFCEWYGTEHLEEHLVHKAA